MMQPAYHLPIDGKSDRKSLYLLKKITYFWKVTKAGPNLTLRKGMLLQRAGATAEKARVLGPTRWNNLVDGICNMPFLPNLGGWADVIGRVGPSYNLASY